MIVIVLCEVKEEIGLVVECVEIFGVLFDYLIGMGFCVMLVVGFVYLLFIV